jgi:DNA-binding GntR family transcriptional regulator
MHIPVNSTLAVSQPADQLPRRVGVSEQVAALLREWIVKRRLAPGESIAQGKLAKQLGIGQATVREALKIAESEGLIAHQPNRGCAVTKLSPEQVGQIFRLRVDLEVLAVELAFETGNNLKHGELVEISQRLKDAARRNEVEEFLRLDIEFHTTLWRLSGNDFLVRMLSQITIPALAFGVIALRPAEDEWVADEHEKIALVLGKGDKEEAKRVTRAAVEAFWKRGQWKNLP